MEDIIRRIPFCKDVNSILTLDKGYSDDQKFVLDGRYLIRLFPRETIQARQEEFNLIKYFKKASPYLPEAIEIHELEGTNYAYMILSYIPGQDGEEALKHLPESAQFGSGVLAGKELKKLHALQAPKEISPWYKRQGRKISNYIEAFGEVPISEEIKHMLINYIRSHEHLMKGRPNTFQHDDFHPANLIFEEGKFVGIIDFQRYDWGDPLYDLTKLGYFSVRSSIPFSVGVVEGYFSPSGPDENFWRIYALYSAMHVVTAYVWGYRLGREHFRRLVKYSKDVIEDHNYFTSTIPNWYGSNWEFPTEL